MKKTFIDAELDIKYLTAKEALLVEVSIHTPDLDDPEYDLGWEL